MQKYKFDSDAKLDSVVEIAAPRGRNPESHGKDQEVLLVLLEEVHFVPDA
jgi:hypothetical protein